MPTATCAGICCGPDGDLQVNSRLGLVSWRPAAGAAPDSTTPVPARTTAMAVILAPGRRDSQITMLTSSSRRVAVLARDHIWTLLRVS
jgi:hypothetical protein